MRNTFDLYSYMSVSFSCASLVAGTCFGFWAARDAVRSAPADFSVSPSELSRCMLSSALELLTREASGWLVLRFFCGLVGAIDCWNLAGDARGPERMV